MRWMFWVEALLVVGVVLALGIGLVLTDTLSPPAHTPAVRIQDSGQPQVPGLPDVGVGR